MGAGCYQAIIAALLLSMTSLIWNDLDDRRRARQFIVLGLKFEVQRWKGTP
jgi:hypothetical protein